jgi:hypothetical protein
MTKFNKTVKVKTPMLIVAMVTLLVFNVAAIAEHSKQETIESFDLA